MRVSGASILRAISFVLMLFSGAVLFISVQGCHSATVSLSLSLTLINNAEGGS